MEQNTETTNFKKQTSLYGSFQSTSGSPKRIIYCVHGKPSAGCCTVLEEQIIDVAPETTPLISYRNTSQILTPAHCHRTRQDQKDNKARRKLIIASILCVLFMLVEIVGGVLSNSLAIATDAAHLLTDFASFMISLFSIWVSNRPATKRMSFGWYRAEVIGALTSVLMIWVVTGILVYIAIERIINRDFVIEAEIMLIVSSFGVVVNIIMGCTLHEHGHSHGMTAPTQTSTATFNKYFIVDEQLDSIETAPSSVTHSEINKVDHGHSHGSNINVRAAFIHVIGDFLQSLGVLAASLVIYFKPDWDMVDPICTFIFSILVLATTYAIIKDTLLVLMEGMPHGIDFLDVMNTFLSIDGVVKVHNLRIWALSLNKPALIAHLAIQPGVAPQKILQEATRNIHEKYDFFEMTLQIEEFQENMEDCSQCKLPSK